MLNGERVAVVVSVHNCAATLARTVAELDRTVIDDVVVVDDASTDDSVSIARGLGLDPIVHERNRGCGGTQKTGYREVLARGADIVVIVHGDYQYSPRLVVPLAAMIQSGLYDVVLGSRFLTQNPLDGGMPRYKYVGNRAMTALENALVSTRFSEFHTGLRAYRGSLLARLPLELDSDDFVFDNEIILQALAADASIGELTCPTRYAPDSSSIGAWDAVRCSVGVIRAGWRYRMHRSGRRSYPFLDIPRD